jgi:hypothetical protein
LTLRVLLLLSLLGDVVWAQPEPTPAQGSEPALDVDSSARPAANPDSEAAPPAPDRPALEAPAATMPPPPRRTEEQPGSALAKPAAPVGQSKQRPRAEPAPKTASSNEGSSKPQTHDGFYLRFATGFGSYDERFQSQANAAYGGRVSAQVRGISGASEVAVGFTPWEGFVIGGGVYSADVLTSTVLVNEGRTLPEGFDATSRDFSMVALFIDRYFVPTLGVHFQAALGVASQTGVDIGGVDVQRAHQAAEGPGLMLGFGYETWMLDQWSLGALVRASFGVLFSRDEAVDARWVHYVVSLPEFLMTVTYH